MAFSCVKRNQPATTLGHQSTCGFLGPSNMKVKREAFFWRLMTVYVFPSDKVDDLLNGCARDTPRYIVAQHEKIFGYPKYWRDRNAPINWTLILRSTLAMSTPGPQRRKQIDFLQDRSLCFLLQKANCLCVVSIEARIATYFREIRGVLGTFPLSHKVI